MSECDRNVREVVTKGFFGPVSWDKELGDHEWTDWSEPKFRCSEYKKKGKKDVEFGYSYQRRTCRHCKVVVERQVC